jgi:hypothetical protein
MEQRKRIVMIATPTSTDNKITKVKRLREYEFCVFFTFLLFGFCFIAGLFFYASIKLKIIFITKNLVIIYKLNIIEKFYYKERDFATILVFLGFFHNPREITKEEESILKENYNVSVNVSIFNG